MKGRERDDDEERKVPSIDAVMSELRLVIFDLVNATDGLAQTIAERTAVREGETGDASGSH